MTVRWIIYMVRYSEDREWTKAMLAVVSDTNTASNIV
jgi:hypothetical protein